jgi:hypothetical protein
MVISILFQAQRCKIRWFKTRCAFFGGFLVCFGVVITNVLVVGYAGDILATHGIRAQAALIFFAIGLEICLKHIFAQSRMDPALCVGWIVFITCSAVVPLRLYTFVLPDLGSVMQANIMNFGCAVAGQIYNYFWFSFRIRYLGKTVEEKYVKIINYQQIHQLFVSHACNMAAFIVVICTDPRYYQYSGLVSTDYQLDLTVFAASVCMSVLSELCHDMVMFKLTSLSQPFVNLPRHMKMPGMTKFFAPFCVLAISISILYCTDVRKACLMCGTENPGLPCLETL